jgi:hypothetical protein
MLRKIIKLTVYSALAYGIYYVFTLYIFYTIAQTATSECNFNSDEVQELKTKKASNLEIEMFMHKRFSCLKEKQNPIQTFFFPVPEKWINPPPGSITYEDIPNS